MAEKKKIALVLSSGGARGIAQIGAIQEILNRGYTITSVAGTSMGAMVGGAFATGKLEEFADWMCSLHKHDVFSLMDFTLSSHGFVKADRVFNEIKKFIPDNLIEDLPIPFTALATDMRKKEPVVFRSGSMFDAIRASVAIPMVVTPALNGKRVLVDGGLLVPIPIDYVEKNKNDLVIVVNVNAAIDYNKPVPEKSNVSKKILSNKYLDNFTKRVAGMSSQNKEESLGFFDLLTNTSNIMLSQISKLILELNPPDILIDISREACETYDFYKASEMISLGKKAAKESLDLFEKKVLF